MLACGLALANAATAAILLALLPRGSQATGWFSYAPLSATTPVGATPHPDWALIAIPATLVVLNLVLVLGAVRWRWLRD